MCEHEYVFSRVRDAAYPSVIRGICRKCGHKIEVSAKKYNEDGLEEERETK